MSNATTYAAARERVTSLVTGADPATPVPACPGWTVKDVVAHLAGVLDDVVAGRMDGAGTPPWTAAQVEARRERSLAECLAEWEANERAAAAILASPRAPTLIADLACHEHDIRGALGQPGARDSDAVLTGLTAMLGRLDQKVRGAGLPAFRVVSDSGEVDTVVGEGEPAATLRAPAFELQRAVTGRRTPSQVRALAWEGDPSPWLDVFFLLGPAARDVHE